MELRGWWDEDEDEYDEGEEAETEAEKAKRQKEYWRSCTRILHDWLHSFAANSAQLRTFRFEWLATSNSNSNNNNNHGSHSSREGPNPFLLDEISSRDGKKQWFSAPRITWASETLTNVWLGNVIVDGKDIGKLKERMKGLERVVVVPECLDGGLGGRKVVVGGGEGGKVWVELDVEGDRVGEWGDVMMAVVDGEKKMREGGEIEIEIDGEGGNCGLKVEGGEKVMMMRGSYCEGRGGGDRASMVLPFLLELSPDDETFS